MSPDFLSSHPDFTSSPSFPLHPSLNGSFSNNPLEQYHFRTVQRIIREHPELTETEQPPVPSFEPKHTLKYNLRTTPIHPPSKMSAKQTMTWNGKWTPLPLTATPISFEASASTRLRAQHLYILTTCLARFFLFKYSPHSMVLIPHLNRRSRCQAPPRHPQSLRREARLRCCLQAGKYLPPYLPKQTSPFCELRT